MTRYAWLAVLLLGTVVSAPAQDDILREMISRAAVVAKVEALELDGGVVEEAGVENWTATCRVLTTVKGKLKADEKITVDCSRLIWKETEPHRFEKGKTYIAFLDPTSWGVYRPIDHWVGILPYHLHLLERTQRIAKEPGEKVRE